MEEQRNSFYSDDKENPEQEKEPEESLQDTESWFPLIKRRGREKEMALGYSLN